MSLPFYRATYDLSRVSAYAFIYTKQTPEIQVKQLYHFGFPRQIYEAASGSYHSYSVCGLDFVFTITCIMAVRWASMFQCSSILGAFRLHV